MQNNKQTNVTFGPVQVFPNKHDMYYLFSYITDFLIQLSCRGETNIKFVDKAKINFVQHIFKIS